MERNNTQCELEEGEFTVIRPQTSLLDLNLKELWRYRDLIRMYVKRDIVTFYKQTILGPLWFVLQPVLTTVMFMFVFGNLAGISTDGIPSVLFYFSGIIIWNYFADCLNRNSRTFTDNQNVFGKVYFPRLVVPISVTISNLVRLAIQFALFVVIYIYFVATDANIAPNLYLLFLPLLILMTAGISLGFGIIFSSLTTKYRDLTFLLQFGVQLWMYATPIIYPLNSIPADKQWLIELNPMTAVIETFKYGALGTGVFSWGWLGYSFVLMSLLILVGIMIFNKIEKSFMDTV
jgi:lipopolysaccharide transport system permease protein